MSFKSWISNVGSKVGNFFGGVGASLGGLFADVLSRLLGFWEFLTVPLGWKHLRHLDLRVVILRDQGGPLVEPSDVHWTIAKTKKIFRDEAEVSVDDAYGIGIVTVDDPSPSYALNFAGGTISGDIGGNFGQVGDYFRDHSANKGKFWSFLNPPITVFVVNRIEKGMVGGVLNTAEGVSVPYFANYALVEAAQFLPPDSPSHTPAHEMVHLCGVLPHSTDPDNLMGPGTLGEKLKDWQVSIVRSSKHVSLF